MTIFRDDLERTSVTGEVLSPVTPGEILREECMVPLGLSARALAREPDVAPNRFEGRARHYGRNSHHAWAPVWHVREVLDESTGGL